MKKEQKILLDLLSYGLFKRDISVSDLSEEEWKAIMIESMQQAVTRIAFKAAKDQNVPQAVYSEWKMYSEMSLATAVINEKDHCILHEWLTEAGIDYVILKGCSSSYYYPRPLDRGMGDIDFLVKESDLKQAGDILAGNGFVPAKEKHDFHIAYHKKNKNYEMHYDIPGVPAGANGELVHHYIEDIFEQSFEYRKENSVMKLPSVFHHGLVNILHICCHLTATGVGLRHLCDWAVFVDSMSDDEFRNLFEDKFKAIGIWKFAAVLTGISEKYLGCRHKPCFDKTADDRLADELIEDILFGGNFGNKDSGRQLEWHMITTNGRFDKRKGNKFSRLVSSMNKSVRRKWKITKKVPFLLPAGWIYFGIKKINRASGKDRKSPSVKNIVDHAGSRQALYDKLELFCVNK